MGVRQLCVQPVVIMFILVATKLTLANKTTVEISDSMVLRAVKAAKQHNTSFCVIDFYLNQQKHQSSKSSNANHRYFNVIENAWGNFLNKCEKLTYATAQTVPSTIGISTPPDPYLEYMEHFWDDANQWPARLEALTKKNQSVIDYYLGQQNESIYREKELHDVLRMTPSYVNVYDSFKVSFGVGPQKNLDGLLQRNKNFSPTTVLVPATTISTKDLKSKAEIQKLISEFNVKNKGQFEELEKLKALMQNMSNPITVSNDRFHNIKTFFKKINVLKRIFERTSKEPNRYFKTIQSNLKKKMYGFLNYVNKIKRLVLGDVFKFRSNTVVKSQNEKIMDWIRQRVYKKSTEKSMDNIIHRDRRYINAEEHFSLNNQTEPKKSESKGIFKKIISFFRRAKSEEDLIKSTPPHQSSLVQRDVSSIPETKINESKLNYNSLPHPTWLGYLRERQKASSKWSTLFTPCLGLTENSSSFNVGNSIVPLLSTRKRKPVIDEVSERNITENFATEKSDELLVYGKRILQKICNTSEEIPIVRVKDYAPNLSTRMGQHWFEALHENMNDSSHDLIFDDDETTTHINQKGLWKYFQKSLQTSTSNNAVVSTLSNSNSPSKDISGASENIKFTSIPPSQNTMFPKRVTTQRNDENLMENNHKSLYCTRSRYTTKIATRETTPPLTTPPGKIAALWKYFQKSMQRFSTDTFSTAYEPRTHYTTLCGVFTYKKKNLTTTTSQKYKRGGEDTFLITDDPSHMINGTFDYEDFNAYMRASACPELAAFFTDTFTTTTTQVTIKKSMLDMIKNVFRGGNNEKKEEEKKKKKTSSEEDLEHYKYLCGRVKSTGNITREEFERRKMGNIKLKYSHESLF